MDLGGIVGIILGVLGIVFAFVFYYKGKKKKKLVYNTESTVLVSEDLSSYENLRISYNGKEITSLTSTTIKIKNIGNDIIEPNDFVPSTPIIIKANGSFLLQDPTKYKIEQDNTKNRVSLEKLDDNTIKVIFDFLKPKDSFSITVLHTGEISVGGDLKQGNVKNYSNKKYETTNKSSIDDDITEYRSKDRRYLEYSTSRDQFSNILFRTILMLMIVITMVLMMIVFVEKYAISKELTNNDELYYLMIPVFGTTLLGLCFTLFTKK